MNVFVTCINGVSGTASIAQRKVARVARELGFDIMGSYKIPEFIDDDNELNHRMDGIISSLRQRDVVIFQFPSWSGLRYEEFLCNHIKAYQNAKLIIFVEDVEALQMDPDRMTLPYCVRLFNKADGLILPSRRMFKVLKEAGLQLTEGQMTYQPIWDYPTDIQVTSHQFIKRMIFTGDPARFPFLQEYKGTTPIDLFSLSDISRQNGQNVNWHGYKDADELFWENAKGGFGLVWCDDTYFEQYYCMNQPYKLGVFLAEGLPVIMRKGSHQEAFIRDNNLGIIAETLDEADQIIQNMSEEEYRGYLAAVCKVQDLSVKGFYTRKTLIDAIIKACENTSQTNIAR
ncbi:sugar transferase [Butyrivibrio sp. NC2007]|uniref:sugar transferase n=1 Tax=Butyrivibrio sp. NC2007 TaxID=1280683 RepID=UPI0003B4E0F1|nr:sugar transferase [Butyrivibrio sp. NC2007]